MKLSAIQYKPPKAQVPLARDMLLSFVEQSAKNGSNIIVCPEMALSGYVFSDAQDILPHTETQTGPTFVALAKIAKAHKCWIVCGFAEQGADGLLYNSAWIINSAGELAGCYRKILLYDLDYTWATAGNQRMLFQTEFGSLAPAICMDLNDNNLIYWMWRSKPDILAFCTNWLNQQSTIDDYWMLRTSYWNGWMVGANTWGVDRDTEFRGESAIIAPNKQTQIKAEITGDCVLYCDTESGDTAVDVREG